MNCHFSQQLTAYLDDELSSQQRASLADHLKKCSACHAQLQALQNEQQLVRNALNQYPRIKAAPDFNLRVLDAVAKRRSRADTFFDRLDAFFARPLYKMLGSSMVGTLFAFLIIAPLSLSSPAKESGNSNLVAAPASGSSPAKAASTKSLADADITPSLRNLYAFSNMERGLGRDWAERLDQAQGTPNTSRPRLETQLPDARPQQVKPPLAQPIRKQLPREETSWNAETSTQSSSLSSGSLC